MVAYNFKKQFADAVRNGDKRQTIRAIGKRKHAKPGDALQLYVGQRTASCERLLPYDVLCTESLAVRLHFESGRIVNVELGDVFVTDLDSFARSDGFASAQEMSEFFASHHDLEGFTGLSPELTLICWDYHARLEPKAKR